MTDVRSDARRNRERVLAAAVEAVAAEGTGVALSAVARRAGVGVATVHRHFPSRDLLLECVLARMLDGVVAGGARVRGAPGPAFFGFLQHVVESTARRGP
ncbi:TetR/AcrR family transcriptional regulator, partial [Pseudonocardia pini]|uniref:TetR/AcrR family transcriptional regulator n=1 Tax=Pseudonocardia pini TaxID=2758030 RepID=UPI0028A63492